MNNLNGKIENNLHNLKGIINRSEKKQPYFIIKLKTQILDKLMIPLINTNWSYINDNYFLFNKFVARTPPPSIRRFKTPMEASLSKTFCKQILLFSILVSIVSTFKLFQIDLFSLLKLFP